MDINNVIPLQKFSKLTKFLSTYITQVFFIIAFIFFMSSSLIPVYHPKAFCVSCCSCHLMPFDLVLLCVHKNIPLHLADLPTHMHLIHSDLYSWMMPYTIH